MDIKRLKPLVNSPLWDELEDYLQYQEENYYKQLINAKDIEVVYRMQGSIKAVQEIATVKDRVNAGQ